MMELSCRNLFIDTQYLINKAFDFQNKEILSLTELAKKGFINVYITDITNKEIEKKITDTVNLALEKITVSDARVLKMLPAFQDFLNIYDKANAATKIRTGYEDFKKNCALTEVSSSKITLMDIFERYCNSKPPFNNSNKKNEFPDAFALEAIVRWSMRTNEKTYLLSGDGDWKSFANQNPKALGFPDDKDRFYYLEDLPELLDAIIRQEESLKDLTSFADKIADEHQDDIQQYVKNKIGNAGFNGISMEENIEIIDAHILFVSMTDKDILSVDREGASYSITFEVVAVFEYEIEEFGPWDNEDHRYLYVEYHSVHQQHIFEQVIDIELGFYDGLPGNFEIISANFPLDLDIDYEEGEYIELEDWWLDRPVLLKGVTDFKITEDGSGEQEFDTLRAAKRFFPQLDVKKSSDHFTEAQEDRFGSQLIFETFLAHFRKKE